MSRWFDRIVHPAQLATALPQAVRVLTDAALCGPVTLALPQDVQTMAHDYPEALFQPEVVTFAAPAPSGAALAEAAAALKAGKLLSISLGNRGQRVPDWQLDPLKRRLVQTILKQTARGVDPWEIYHALTQPYDEFGGQSPIEAVTLETLEMAVQVVRRALLIQQIDGPLPRREGGTTRSSALA